MSAETTISLDARYVRDESVVARLIGQEFLLVPTRSNVAELDNIYVLNEVAGRIWELLDGQRNLKDILDILLNEFDVDEVKIQLDIVEFIKRLRDFKLIAQVE